MQAVAEPCAFPCLRDKVALNIVAESSAVASQYGASAFPTHVLINKQGQIEFVRTGGSTNSQDELRPLIKNLLK